MRLFPMTLTIMMYITTVHRQCICNLAALETLRRSPNQGISPLYMHVFKGHLRELWLSTSRNNLPKQSKLWSQRFFSDFLKTFIYFISLKEQDKAIILRMVDGSLTRTYANPHVSHLLYYCATDADPNEYGQNKKATWQHNIMSPLGGEKGGGGQVVKALHSWQKQWKRSRKLFSYNSRVNNLQQKSVARSNQVHFK